MMTVKELKDIIKDWPEITDRGELAEVWIETGLMLSSQVTNHCRLGPGHFLLESNAFEDHTGE